MRADEAGVPIISSMGAGNKMDPTAFEAADIYETSVCPLARVMRRELRKRGIRALRVVYSKEPPMTPLDEAAASEEPESCRVPMADITGPSGEEDTCAVRRSVPGSNAFVPPAAGLIIAGEVVKALTGFGGNNGKGI